MRGETAARRRPHRPAQRPTSARRRLSEWMSCHLGPMMMMMKTPSLSRRQSEASSATPVSPPAQWRPLDFPAPPTATPRGEAIKSAGLLRRVVVRRANETCGIGNPTDGNM
eukprot:scaffold146513_cov36-Prasinocladus_malaysianus.AAC.1